MHTITRQAINSIIADIQVRCLPQSKYEDAVRGVYRIYASGLGNSFATSISTMCAWRSTIEGATFWANISTTGRRKEWPGIPYIPYEPYDE